MNIDHPPRDGIVLTALRKSYGSVPAVRGIDLCITPGETVALLGPNGAGKTTTIDMLLGLARPDGGQVTLFGLSPADAVATGRVGGMLQTGALVDGPAHRDQGEGRRPDDPSHPHRRPAGRPRHPSGRDHLAAHDPDGAVREIGEVAALSRRALADVRAAVSNYREVTLAGELATGHELLRAAGIAAELPPAADVVDAG